MIMRLRRVLNNKGLTLVEMILALLVFAIITVAAASFFGPTLKAYIQANDLAEVNTLLDTIATIVMEDLVSATEVSTATPTGISFMLITTHEITYAVVTDSETNRGVLERTGFDAIPRPILDPGFYGNISLHEASLERDDDILILKLVLGTEDGWTTSREYAVRPVGLRD